MATNPEADKPDSPWDQRENVELRARSGDVWDRRPLVSFLYELLRDHLPASTVETIARNSYDPGVTRYCNGYLAKYAQDIATRLGVPPVDDTAEPEITSSS